MRGALSFCLLAFFYLLWTPFDKASDLPVIKDSEATQFVGQNVEVKGLVVAVHTSRKGNTFINFGVPYPNQTFTGWIPPGSAVLDDASLASLSGKTIGIAGLIQLYKGKPEIRILSKDQIHSD